MASAYPTAEDIGEAVRIFCSGTNEYAVYAQLVSVCESCPSRTREYAALVAESVAMKYCECTETPQPFPADMDVETKRELAARPDHPGLCGKAMGAAIASVTTEGVRRRGQLKGKRFRNQACYEGSKALNATGSGVQVCRQKCYARAAQALFPGEDLMHPAVLRQFSDSTL